MTSNWQHPFILQRVLAYSAKSFPQLIRSGHVNAAFNETLHEYGGPILELLYEKSPLRYWNERFATNVVHFARQLISTRLWVYDRLPQNNNQAAASLMEWFINLVLDSAQNIDHRAKLSLTFEGNDASKVVPKKRKGISFGATTTVVDKNNNKTEESTTSEHSVGAAAVSTSRMLNLDDDNSAPPKKTLTVKVLSECIIGTGTLIHLISRCGLVNLLKKVVRLEPALVSRLVRYSKYYPPPPALSNTSHNDKNNSEADIIILKLAPDIPQNCLFLAVATKSLEMVRFLLQEFNLDPFEVLDNGKSLLHACIMADFDEGDKNILAGTNNKNVMISFFFDELGFPRRFLQQQQQRSDAEKSDDVSKCRSFLATAWTSHRQDADHVSFQRSAFRVNLPDDLTALLLAIKTKNMDAVERIFNCTKALGSPTNFDLFTPSEFQEAFFFSATSLSPEMFTFLLRSDPSGLDMFRSCFTTSKIRFELLRGIATSTAHPPAQCCAQILAILQLLHRIGFPLDAGSQNSTTFEYERQLSSRPLPAFTFAHGTHPGAVEVLRYWCAPEICPRMISLDATVQALSNLFRGVERNGGNDDDDDDDDEDARKENVDAFPVMNEVVDFFLQEIKIDPNLSDAFDYAIINKHNSAVKKMLESGYNFTFGFRRGENFDVKKNADSLSASGSLLKDATLFEMVHGGNPEMLEMVLSFVRQTEKRLRQRMKVNLDAHVDVSHRVYPSQKDSPHSWFRSVLYSACSALSSLRPGTGAKERRQLSTLPTCIQILLNYGANPNCAGLSQPRKGYYIKTLESANELSETNPLCAMLADWERFITDGYNVKCKRGDSDDDDDDDDNYPRTVEQLVNTLNNPKTDPAPTCFGFDLMVSCLTIFLRNPSTDIKSIRSSCNGTIFHVLSSTAEKVLKPKSMNKNDSVELNLRTQRLRTLWHMLIQHVGNSIAVEMLAHKDSKLKRAKKM